LSDFETVELAQPLIKIERKLAEQRQKMKIQKGRKNWVF